MFRFFTYPLRVTVYELDNNPRIYAHRARDFRDAIEWAECYPVHCVVVIRSRFGRFIAQRGE